MNGMLFLDAAALRRQPDDLHTVLRDHVGTDRAATRILRKLLDAAHRGSLSHCVIVPESAGSPQPDGGWNVRVVYEDEHAAPAPPTRPRTDEGTPIVH